MALFCVDSRCRNIFIVVVVVRIAEDIVFLSLDTVGFDCGGDCKHNLPFHTRHCYPSLVAGYIILFAMLLLVGV